MYLIDSNIFLEILLEQERKGICENFLRGIDPESIYISRFSLYSIGLMLSNRKDLQLYNKFIDEIVSNINVVHLELDSLKEIGEVKRKFNLDFDDAYQYLSAEKLHLKIVSFDKDFDKTDTKRIEP